MERSQRGLGDLRRMIADYEESIYPWESDMRPHLRPNGFGNDDAEVAELVLYIQNTSALWGPGSQGESIRKNLERKLDKGTFDAERSIQAFTYLTDAGAKSYVREFGSPGDSWHEMFPKDVRRKAAAVIAAEWLEEENLQREQPGYRPNFLFGKKELSPEEKARQELAQMRKSQRWKDKYNYYKVQYGMKMAEAEKAADEAYLEWRDRQRKLEGKDVAFHRNSSALRPEREDFDDALTQAMLEAYLVTALWSSTDENEEPFDSRFDIGDFAESAQDQAAIDLERFLNSSHKGVTVYDLLVSDPDVVRKSPRDLRHSSEEEGRFALAGHELWLTRNGHGAGFWDGDWREPESKWLTQAAEDLGEVYIYEGDDGELYFE